MNAHGASRPYDRLPHPLARRAHEPGDLLWPVAETVEYLRREMRAAVEDFVPFDEAYSSVDWSAYADMPAFEASNRGNAYRIYLEMEAEQFK